MEAQLVETTILNILNHQCLIATKASRVVFAAGGDSIMEFGLRRAQGPDAGLYLSLIHILLFSKITRSYRNTVCITIRTSWYPLSRLPRISSPRLILPRDVYKRQLLPSVLLLTLPSAKFRCRTLLIFYTPHGAVLPESLLPELPAPSARTGNCSHAHSYQSDLASLKMSSVFLPPSEA